MLVSQEDYKNNINKYLNDNIDFTNKTVCEFGVGTGRITKTYINQIENADLFDRFIHKLEKVKVNFKNNLNKITLSEFNNQNIDKISKYYDISIEGWSFGYLISENGDNIDYWSNKIINELKK